MQASEIVEERLDEPHVVALRPHRRSAADPAVPRGAGSVADLDAVGVDDDEAVALGQRFDLVVRRELVAPPGAAVEPDEQRDRAGGSALGTSRRYVRSTPATLIVS